MVIPGIHRSSGDIANGDERICPILVATLLCVAIFICRVQLFFLQRDKVCKLDVHKESCPLLRLYRISRMQCTSCAPLPGPQQADANNRLRNNDKLYEAALGNSLIYDGTYCIDCK